MILSEERHTIPESESRLILCEGTFPQVCVIWHVSLLLPVQELTSLNPREGRESGVYLEVADGFWVYPRRENELRHPEMLVVFELSTPTHETDGCHVVPSRGV